MKIVLRFSFMLFMIVIAACSSNMDHRLLSHSYGSYCSKTTNCALTGKLTRNGVNVYHLGDQITIAMPASLLFDGTNVVLSHDGRTRLKAVAKLLRCYQKIKVRICLYYQGASDKDYTQMRATAVQDYMTRLTSNTRLLYTEIAQTSGSRPNTVEFITRKLP